MNDRPAPAPRVASESTKAESGAVDLITGFLNRNAGLQAVARALSEANARRSQLAVLWVDIDRFRQINDSFGHAGGDSVIIRIAERIRSSVSTPAEFVRMGSDEFVVMLADSNRLDAERIANKLLGDIEIPLPIEEILIRPSASIGIALGQVDDYPLGLLERADRAMIEAKRQGGNRFVISGDEAASDRLGVTLMREELAIESALHAALEGGGLSLEYQPIIRQNGSIEAVEALMRCNALGLQIPPEKLIPVAEKTGLILRLGEWSLLQGARCAALLREHGHTTKVAINVSRAQLMSQSFIHALHGALICADVAAELIELELTESLFMDNSATVQANLRGAREAGVGLAIDDFGTGYSCLSTLKDIAASKLKFDRAFISVLPTDRRAFAVVRAMTRLGRELGMIVVAEGVETPQQLDACAAAGLDATQGFYNARPMSEDALLMWMESRNQQ